MIRWEMQVRRLLKRMIISNKHLPQWKVLISVKAGAEQGHSLEIIYKNQ